MTLSLSTSESYSPWYDLAFHSLLVFFPLKFQRFTKSLLVLHLKTHISSMSPLKHLQISSLDSSPTVSLQYFLGQSTMSGNQQDPLNI